MDRFGVDFGRFGEGLGRVWGVFWEVWGKLWHCWGTFSNKYCAPRRNYLINSKKGPNGTGSWKLILPRDPTDTVTYPPVLKNQVEKNGNSKINSWKTPNGTGTYELFQKKKERPVVSLWGTVL